MATMLVLGSLLFCLGGAALVVCAVSDRSVRRTLKACTKVVPGVYVREDRSAHVHAPGFNASSYAAVVRFETPRGVREEQVAYSEGLSGFADLQGKAVEVHYDPRNPSLCWARDPEARWSMARVLPVARLVSKAVLVVGAVMAFVARLFLLR